MANDRHWILPLGLGINFRNIFWVINFCFIIAMPRLCWLGFILLMLVLHAGTVEVPCPQNPNYADCYHCSQYTPFYPIECKCSASEFSILGECFSAPYPCSRSLMSLTNNPNYTEYNIWEPTIAPFWSQKFEAARNHTTEPNPLPTILNYYNFTNMTSVQTIGWTQAYFMYQAYKNEIQSLSMNQQYVYLFQAVVAIEGLLGKTFLQKWQNATSFINLKLGRNYTYKSLIIETRSRVQKIAPCQKCSDLYGLIFQNNTTRCSKCPPNCLNCTNNTSTCGACLPGNYLTATGSCLPCGRSNCVACNATQCFGCAQTHNIAAGNCVQCDGNCLECVQEFPTACTRCTFAFFGQTPKSNGQCVECDKFCWDCDPDKPSNCTTCQDLYYVDQQSWTCKPCPQNCMVCFAGGCVECIYGYGLIDGSCQICKTPGCMSCNYNASTCTSCIRRFFSYNYTTSTCDLNNVNSVYLDYRYEVLDCRAGCDYCYDNDTSKCMSCHPRYYMVDGYYCKKCMPGCLECVNSATCLTPLTGYVIKQNVAVKCPNNCRECSPTNTSKCLYCRSGYQLQNLVCVPNNRPQCLVFYDLKTSQCAICMPGYALTDANSCIQCVSGCDSTCNPRNISQCYYTRFMLGDWALFKYYLGNQGCQIQVNGHCLLPTQGFRIEKSANGSFNVAIQCLYPCATCNETTCFSCEPGYIFSNGKCSFDFSCNPNCTQCLAGTQRNPANNFCIACTIEGCSSCKDGICYECIEGLYFNGTACAKCPQKCRVCYDANNCNICAIGYLWPLQFKDYSYDCVKCDENCKTCKFQANTCTQCYPGMKLINFRCRKQFHLAFTYKLDYDYNAFLSNMKSEVLIGALMNILQVKYNDIFITSIASGSTIVSGVVSAIDQAAARSLFNQLKSATLTGFTVKGYSVSFMNDEYTVKCVSKGSAECPAGTEGLSPGAIAGIVIGSIVGVVLIVVGIVCAVKRCRRPDTAGQSEQGEVQIKSSTNKSVSIKSGSINSATALQKQL